MSEVDPELLLGHWIHSHEESEDDRFVFRSADYPFPPARGRRAFVLRDAGDATSGGPGPDDRPVEEQGDWTLDGSLLSVRTPIWSIDLEIESLERGLLIARRYAKEATDNG